jgi:hypothetical protein
MTEILTILADPINFALFTPKIIDFSSFLIFKSNAVFGHFRVKLKVCKNYHQNSLSNPKSIQFHGKVLGREYF